MAHLGQCTRQAPGHLSCSDLERAQNARPTKSVPLQSTREPEPEQLTPGIVCLPTPGHLSSSDLGRAHNAGPTESVPLWSTLEPEPEQLRPGKYMQPRAYFGQFPYRATWKLRSVDQESTHTVSGGKPIVDQTLKHSPHMSVIFVCSVPPYPQHN